MAIENVTHILIETNYWDVPFWVDLVAACVIGVLAWQVLVFKKQGRLAYDPLMSVRFQKENNTPYVVIQNIGHGTAVDVKLEIWDAVGNKKIRDFNAFALQKRGGRITDVSFDQYPKIFLKGKYANIVGKRRKASDTVFDYEELKKGL